MHIANTNLPVFPHVTIRPINPHPGPPAHARHILLTNGEDGLRGRVMSINTHRRKTLRVPIYLRRRLWELTHIVPQWVLWKCTTPGQVTGRARILVHRHASEDGTKMAEEKKKKENYTRKEGTGKPKRKWKNQGNGPRHKGSSTRG